MTYTLSNDLLTVSIQDAGAQLCSVRSAGGTEYLWQADPAVWGRHAPLLFPLIGRLQDSQYTLDGRAWSISTHGFARDAQFQVSEQGPTALSFQLEDSEETRRVYPFSFVLTVTYTLEGSRLTKAHRVENRSAVPMLYELGGHDGFRTPLEPGETMADYAVTISGVEELRPYGMDSRCMLTIGEARFPLEEGASPCLPGPSGWTPLSWTWRGSAGLPWWTAPAGSGWWWSAPIFPIWDCGRRTSPLIPATSVLSPGLPSPTRSLWAGAWRTRRASAGWSRGASMS